MSVRLPRDVQYDIARRSAFYAQLLERLDAMPRVTAAAVATAAPLTWKGGSNGLSIDGRAPQPGQSALHRQISADYFSVLGIPVRAGRVLEASDRDATLPVAVVNETMARQFWPDDDPIGKRFKMGPPESPNPWLTVVGVVGDVKNIGVDAPVRPEMYLPYEQVSYNASFAPAALVVRSVGDPLDLVTSIRQAVRDLDPLQPISKVQTLEAILAAETATRGVGTSLMGRLPACRSCWRPSACTASCPTPCRNDFRSLGCAWRSAPNARTSSDWSSATACGWRSSAAPQASPRHSR